MEGPDSEDDSLDNDDKAEQVKPTEQRAGRNKIVAGGDGESLGNKSAFKTLGKSSSPQRKNEGNYWSFLFYRFN